MQTDISHIPEDKKTELNKVVDIIKNTTYKTIGAEMIILYGSYARGDFVVRDVVQEGGSARVYESDFDIFVITKKPTQEKNLRLAKEISNNIKQESTIDSPFNIIIEDIHHVNKMLEEARYFYVDMTQEGILLYDSQKYKLSTAKKLSPERRKEIKQEDYDNWIYSAEGFLIDFRNALERGDYKKAAFYLHGAAEGYISAYLLVKTGYKPKTHNLEELYKKVLKHDATQDGWFDMMDDTQYEYFDLLKRSYIEARYSKEYFISDNELNILREKITWLEKMVKTQCKDDIKY